MFGHGDGMRMEERYINAAFIKTSYLLSAPVMKQLPPPLAIRQELASSLICLSAVKPAHPLQS